MRIRELRLKYGYTQNYAASCLHICQNTYSRYENGKRQIPTHLLISLADLYHTSTDYILGLTDNPIPHLRNPTKGASPMPKTTSILCLLDISAQSHKAFNVLVNWSFTNHDICLSFKYFRWCKCKFFV